METFNDVISGNQLVLVDFFATWCQPCKMMHPVLDQVKATLGDRIRIVKVDVDQHSITAGRHQVRSVPTLMLFRNGEMLWRQSGAMSKTDLLSVIEPFLDKQD
ncbi:MAG: thioredoxin [Prevotella sp.]|nr:thioredoxin [Prevotella sp.]